jgi:orotidine-5'-phosphate decarboxylase
MTPAQLHQAARQQAARLCIGLDTDPDKLPGHLPRTAEGILRFNRAIIDATRPHCIGYKLNTAYYEALGGEGWEAMRQTADYIGEGWFRIADAKRGDIGNTARQYARALLGHMPFDAVTLSPYMGIDALLPFLEYPEAMLVVLGQTSNPDALSVQGLRTDDGRTVYQRTMAHIAQHIPAGRLMWVVGATRPEVLRGLSQTYPDHGLLVPGLGAQGGSVAETLHALGNHRAPLLLTASRAIIYADGSKNFANTAAKVAAGWEKSILSSSPA